MLDLWSTGKDVVCFEHTCHPFYHPWTSLYRGVGVGDALDVRPTLVTGIALVSTTVVKSRIRKHLVTWREPRVMILANIVTVSRW